MFQKSRGCNLEPDPRYPSGEWSGFYKQPDSEKRHWMLFYLEFGGGQIRGEGNDWVGAFHLSGTYDTSTGRCRWTKQYLGRHRVEYEGVNQGQGIIGVWTIADDWSDHFHIWPKGMGNLEEMYLEAERPQEITAPSRLA